MEKEELGVVHAPFYLIVFSFVEYLIQMEYSQEVGVVEWEDLGKNVTSKSTNLSSIYLNYSAPTHSGIPLTHHLVHLVSLEV